MSGRGVAARIAAGSAAAVLMVSGILFMGGQAMAIELRPGAGMVNRAAPRPATAAGLDTTQATLLAAQLDARLGLAQPASWSVLQAVDPGTGMTVAEVTELSIAGVPTMISRFDSTGGLVSAVRLGYVVPAATAIAGAAASGAASAILGKVGIPATGSPAVSTRAAGGWLVRWVRQVGTVPVPGDGIGVQLDPDGSFHGIVRTQHSLAPIPASTIDAAAARQLGSARLDAWLPAAVRSEATISSVGQAWIAPNDTFGDAIPGGSGVSLHLAWIVRVTMTGSLADTVGGLEMAFDAGTGTPLGGDLLE
jgi:hypothetical protein